MIVSDKKKIMKKTAIVITLGKHHVHYCKALIASIEFFNPELPIVIIKDGVFNTKSLEKRKNVSVVNSKEINKIHQLDLYILLNKLNILFLPQIGFDFDCYIHLDADSILTNPIEYEFFNQESDFFILQGNVIKKNNNEKMNNLAHYAFNPLDFPEYSFDDNELYFFSASHIAINKRIIPKLIELLKKHRYELNKEFINDKRIRFNDQCFLNLMINYLSHIKEIVVKIKDMGIYGKQAAKDFPKLTLQNIQKKSDTEVMFIHYTAPSRKVIMKAHNFGDLLDYFLRLFYNNGYLFYIDENLRYARHYRDWFWKRAKNKLKHISKKI